MHNEEDQEAEKQSSCQKSPYDPELRREIGLPNYFHGRLYAVIDCVSGGVMLGLGNMWKSDPNCSRNSTANARCVYDSGNRMIALI